MSESEMMDDGLLRRDSHHTNAGYHTVLRTILSPTHATNRGGQHGVF
jgi:hypothetical protein